LEFGEYEEAEAAFSNLLEQPNKGGSFQMQGYHGRGLARYHQWKPEALDDFSFVAREAEDPNLREHAQFMVAIRHFELGQDQDAIAICEALLKDSPESRWAPEIRFRLAQFAFNAGRYADAEAAFLSFAELHAEHAYAPQSLLRAGQSAIRRQQFVRGNEILGKMAQQFPNDPLLPLARFHQAEALMQLGRHSTAILTFQEVIRLAPNTELAYMSWGREGDCHFILSSENASRLEQAARSYQVVLQGGDVRFVDKLQAACKLGMTFEKMGRQAAALEQYHDGVMIPFHLEKNRGGDIGAEEITWYSRAVRNAIEILEQQEDWRRLAGVLDRVSSSGTELAEESARRARAIRSEYWWLFY
jgi:tetratricopeptide (TPR) repeat protein